MCDAVREAGEEVAVVASVLEQLTRDGGTLGAAHVDGLVRRLRHVAACLDGSAAVAATTSKREDDDGDDAQTCATAAAATHTTAARAASRCVVTKPSSLSAVRVPRARPPRDAHVLARDVTRVLTSSLYNMLESLARVLAASRVRVLVRRGDDMVAIANVAAQLHFPPQLTRHRCAGAADAEVLASGVALNQHTVAAARSNSSITPATTPTSLQPRSWLLFPVYAHCSSTTTPTSNAVIAVLSVEDKARGTRAFDAHDEAVAYLATLLLGELLTRVRDFDWVAHFYDPAAQHVVAPFDPAVAPVDTTTAAAQLPPLRAASTQDSDVATRLAQHRAEVLIRRQAVTPSGRLVVPSAATSHASGLTQLPSLREVDAYVANMQHCWKTSVASNVALMESDREAQNELRALRRSLAETQAALARATQRLRLYELDTSDYRREYHDLRVELDTFFGKNTSSTATTPSTTH